MARNDSRPFACSASMMLRSRSSVRRAGATGPRSEPLVGIRSGWTSSLRIAQDSYHSAAHFVNANGRERLFARGRVDARRGSAYAARLRSRREEARTKDCALCLLGLPDLAPGAPLELVRTRAASHLA